MSLVRVELMRLVFVGVVKAECKFVILFVGLGCF